MFCLVSDGKDFPLCIRPTLGDEGNAGHIHLACGYMQVLTLWCGGEAYEFSKPIIRSWARTGTLQSAAGTVISPLPGKIIKVSLSPLSLSTSVQKEIPIR